MHDFHLEKIVSSSFYRSVFAALETHIATLNQTFLRPVDFLWANFPSDVFMDVTDGRIVRSMTCLFDYCISV